MPMKPAPGARRRHGQELATGISWSDASTDVKVVNIRIRFDIRFGSPDLTLSELDQIRLRSESIIGAVQRPTTRRQSVRGKNLPSNRASPSKEMVSVVG